MTKPTCPNGPIEDCTDEGCTHFFDTQEEKPEMISLPKEGTITAEYRDGHQIIKEEVRERCLGCGYEIDPDICWCGVENEKHFYEEHQFVPGGCVCLYAEHKGRDEWRAFIRTLANQKLKEGLEMALEMVKNEGLIAASKGMECDGGWNQMSHGLIAAGTAIKSEIEKLTPKP